MKAFTDELIQICRHFGVFEREQICCGTVTVQQCLVLQVLRGAEHDMGSLAAFAGVSVSAMTRIVDGLERHAWIERRRDELDRRRVLVALTREGEAEATRLRSQTDAIVGRLFEHIPKGKRKQVLDSLRILRGAMAETQDLLRSCCDR